MKNNDHRIKLWDAINAYTIACGGNPGLRVYGNTSRMKAVAEVEDLVYRAANFPKRDLGRKEGGVGLNNMSIPEYTPEEILLRVHGALGDTRQEWSHDELIGNCQRLTHSLEFNRLRVRVLESVQSKFRDPERVVLCDVLANGQLLPDSGVRYGFATTGKEHLQYLKGRPK